MPFLLVPTCSEKFILKMTWIKFIERPHYFYKRGRNIFRVNLLLLFNKEYKTYFFFKDVNAKVSTLFGDVEKLLSRVSRNIDSFNKYLCTMYNSEYVLVLHLSKFYNKVSNNFV